MGLSHEEVVTILKDLPVHVRLVCARRAGQPIIPQFANLDESLPFSEPAADESDEVQLPDMSLDISMGSSGPPDVESEISANVITEVRRKIHYKSFQFWHFSIKIIPEYSTKY